MTGVKAQIVKLLVKAMLEAARASSANFARVLGSGIDHPPAKDY
jgi:hypothetical protein